MIVSYRDKKTGRFAAGGYVREFSSFARQAETRLDRLEAAQSLQDLGALPGNRLEALKGGQGSTASVSMTDGGFASSGRRGVTTDTALRLGHWFGTSAEFWLTLQNLYELRLARREIGGKLEKLPRLAGCKPRQAPLGSRLRKSRAS